MQYTFTIPDFVPTSVNALLEMHHMKAHRVKQGDMDIIGHYFRESGIPKATGKRRLSFVCYRQRGRKPDPSNLRKVLEDGLVKAGALIDDSERWLVIGTEQVETGPRATVITLEDLE